MNPLDRLRLQKAGADCGFEMTAGELDDGVVLRSARFPETVHVVQRDGHGFELRASDPHLLDDSKQGDLVSVQGYGELYSALRLASARARTKPNRVADAFRIETASLPRSTEAERLVVQRVGQKLFRSALLDFWQGRCCVTGLSVTQVLRASHIKPWAQCATDDERLDVFNGLLLSPNLDALFDAGLVTVDPAGAILVSSALDHAAQGALGLVDKLWVLGLRSRHFAYLEYHRRFVWTP